MDDIEKLKYMELAQPPSLRAVAIWIRGSLVHSYAQMLKVAASMASYRDSQRELAETLQRHRRTVENFVHAPSRLGYEVVRKSAGRVRYALEDLIDTFKELRADFNEADFVEEPRATVARRAIEDGYEQIGALEGSIDAHRIDLRAFSRRIFESGEVHTESGPLSESIPAVAAPLTAAGKSAA